MINQFNFKGFDPTDAIKYKADIVLDEIMNRAPFGAFVNALIEKENDHYRCRINIFSKQGPFDASVIDSDPIKTLEKVENTLVKKLIHWRKSKNGFQQLYA